MAKLPSKDTLRARGFQLYEQKNLNEGQLAAAAGFKKYKKVEPVWARQMEKSFKCDTLEGDNIKGKAGDYLCIGVEGETWPIDKDIFEKSYRLAE
jgi:hypothetical protein